MGSEAKVEAILDGRKSEVRAHLDSESLQLSGRPRIILPLEGIRADTQKEWLVVRAEQKIIRLRLGVTKAALWAKKISNPPSLATKLGLKPTSTVWLSNDAAPEIVAAIQEIGAKVLLGREPGPTPVDLIFIDFHTARDENHFHSVKPFLNDANAVWVIFRKGQTGPGEATVTNAGRQSGLRDTKVAKISLTHTGLRFVLPRT